MHSNINEVGCKSVWAKSLNVCDSRVGHARGSLRCVTSYHHFVDDALGSHAYGRVVVRLKEATICGHRLCGGD
eukprot:786046-Pleurochrysis_carterae.AAC.1